MRALITSLLLFSLACGETTNKPWRAGSAVRVRVSVGVDVPVTLNTANDAITARLAEFGIPVDESGYKEVRIMYDAYCACPGCNKETTAAYTTNVINICDNFTNTLSKTPRAHHLILGHELGHLLGFHGHVVANGLNLMAPLLENYKDVMGYSATDIAAICAAGYVSSPVCTKN